jgi:collagenase-like PrtC family protease
MKFAVGYQLAAEGEEPFADLIAEYVGHVAEVYVAPPGEPSGRSPLPDDGNASARFEDDLRRLRDMGVGLNLLLNANCYGGAAQSRALERRVVGHLGRLADVAGGADAVTTASPAVAAMVGRHFPKMPVIASVNMRIGTMRGMDYVAGLFDGYCVQRDYNRRLGRLRRLRAWADAHGKSLSMLANSGCLRFCSAQTFHDNLVAHETEVAAADNIDYFLPYACWNYLREQSHWPAVLQATWVRPEDLHNYDGLFDVVKLATRMHERPWVVLRAYVERRYDGNLLDLFEPGFSRAFAPYVVDNSRFPADWFERTAGCDGHCEECGYCAAVLKQVLRRLPAPAAGCS